MCDTIVYYLLQALGSSTKHKANAEEGEVLSSPHSTQAKGKAIRKNAAGITSYVLHYRFLNITFVVLMLMLPSRGCFGEKA